MGASLIGDPAVGGKWVPDFSWGESGQEYDINKFLETAETVFGRRQRNMEPRHGRSLAGSSLRNPGALEGREIKNRCQSFAEIRSSGVG